jgi:hypothetical protein
LHENFFTLIFEVSKKQIDMLAYKINAANRKVEAIEINDWKDIAPAIGGECKLFDAPVKLDNGDTFYADEQELYHTCEGGWRLIEDEDFPLTILGNALVLGTDEDGTEPRSSIEDIEAIIIWVSKENCETYRNHVLNRPPMVFTDFKKS